MSAARKRTRVMKALRPSIYACGCLDAVNQQLATRNTRVETCFTMNFTTGTQGEALLLHTAKCNPKKPGKALKVSPNYCPWCGVKYGQ